MNSTNWVSVSTPYITPRASGETDAWTEDAARRGGRGTNEIAFAGEVASPAFVAEAFGINEGGPVVARRRIVRFNDKPVEIATSYYPTSIAAGTPLARPAKIKGGAVTLLAQLGYATAHVTEDVFAHEPSAEEQSDLQIGDGEAVVTIQRTSRSSDGGTFQAEIMTAPARARRLRYEMEVG